MEERTRKTLHRGMTLVEVLAVVVILGLIAATLLVSFSGSVDEAKQNLARSGIGVIQGKLEMYKIATGTFPTTDIGLAALSTGLAQPTDSYFLGPDQLLDPWNHAYYYVAPGPDGYPYEVICYGADGQPGGDGENTDVSSTNLRANESAL